MPSTPHFDRLLLTGATGVMGRVLRTCLKPHCTTLRLSDINPLGDAAAGEELHPLLRFVLGTLLYMAATILICTPIFLPIAMQFGCCKVGGLFANGVRRSRRTVASVLLENVRRKFLAPAT